MKILICSTNDIVGGAGRAAYRLLKGLHLMNLEAGMLVLYKNSGDSNVYTVSEIVKQKKINKIVMFLLTKLKQYRNIKKWNKYPGRDKMIAVDDIHIGQNKKIFSLIDHNMVHLHFIEGGFLNLKEFKGYVKPIIWTLHGCFPFTGLCHYFADCDKFKTECGNCPILRSGKDNDLSRINFRKKRRLYRKLDITIITPSKWLGLQVKDSALMGHLPIHVIPNGIDTQIFKPVDKKTAREALNLDTDKKIVLYGAMSALSDKRKGYELLKQSISLLKKLYDSDDMELVVFGDESTNSEDSHFKTTYLGQIVNDRMIALVYSMADVTVVPSLHENLPNIIMESLSCGTSVTAFDIGGNRDMIDHKKNGYLAKPYEVEDLATGIQWCLENNNNNQLNLNSRQKVMDNFSLEIVSQKHLDLYQSIMNRKNNS